MHRYSRPHTSTTPTTPTRRSASSSPSSSSAARLHSNTMPPCMKSTWTVGTSGPRCLWKGSCREGFSFRRFRRSRRSRRLRGKVLGARSRGGGNEHDSISFVSFFFVSFFSLVGPDWYGIGTGVRGLLSGVRASLLPSLFLLVHPVVLFMYAVCRIPHAACRSYRGE